jgi:hypothetical protein
MSCPDFQVGDEVEYELADDDLPRWDVHRDRGGSGRWETGIVEKKDSHVLTIIMPRFHNHWHWNLSGPPSDYVPDQWQRPGYLRLKKKGHFGIYVGKYRLVDRGGYFGTVMVEE